MKNKRNEHNERNELNKNIANNDDIVIIHSDGACRGNPGIGAFAATIQYKQHTKEITGVEERTTNNQMELKAVIVALQALLRRCNVIVYTDSKYVQMGISTWIVKWKEKNWRGIKNVQLWQELDSVASKHNISWQWVKGHNNHAGNEYVDKLANIALDEYLGIATRHS